MHYNYYNKKINLNSNLQKKSYEKKSYSAILKVYELKDI